MNHKPNLYHKSYWVYEFDNREKAPYPDSIYEQRMREGLKSFKDGDYFAASEKFFDAHSAESNKVDCLLWVELSLRLWNKSGLGDNNIFGWFKLALENTDKFGIRSARFCIEFTQIHYPVELLKHPMYHAILRHRYNKELDNQQDLIALYENTKIQRAKETKSMMDEDVESLLKLSSDYLKGREMSTANMIFLGRLLKNRNEPKQETETDPETAD